jgi:hypothetical protein
VILREPEAVPFRVGEVRAVATVFSAAPHFAGIGRNSKCAWLCASQKEIVAGAAGFEMEDVFVAE